MTRSTHTRRSLVARVRSRTAVLAGASAAIALFAWACGGTTGMEGPTGSSPSGASDASARNNASIDAGDAGLDGTVPEPSNDGGEDAAIDVTILYADADRFPDVGSADVASTFQLCMSGFDAGNKPGCVPSGMGPAGLIMGNSATCTPTEQLIFALKGQDCLSCLFGNFCLDDTTGPPDINQECADMAKASAPTGSLAASCPEDYLCYVELQCILASSPNCAASGAANCYCGTIVAPANCLTPGAPNGLCLVPEEQAHDYVPGVTTPADVNMFLATPTDPATLNPTPTSGGQIPNSILYCAHAGNCNTCYQ